MKKLNALIKKGMVINGLLLLPFLAFAQDAPAANGPLDWAYDNLLLISVGGVLLYIMVSYAQFVIKMIKFQQKELMIARGEYVAPEPEEERESIFKKLYDKAWDLVPIDKEQDIDLGHEYDGIRELDNKLPPWWLYMFYATILWGVAYIYVSHYSEFSQTQTEEYLAEMEVAEEARIRYLAQQKNLVDETNVVAMTDPADLDAGQGIYTLNCVACHGIQGEGGLGPNLTDPNWIHGGGIKNVFKRIKYGVPEKGMIAWKAQLQPKAMQQVASYVMTLQGNNPPNGKKPEGEIWVEEAEEGDEISMNNN